MSSLHPYVVNWASSSPAYQRTFLPAVSRPHVPLQEKPVSNPSILPSEVADFKYSTPEEVVNALNFALSHTSLTVNFPIYFPLREIIGSFIARGLDFGSIYARMRPSWPKSNIPTVRPPNWLECQLVDGVSYADGVGKSDSQVRSGSTIGQAISKPGQIKPRRVWDLHANRVIPHQYSYSLPRDKMFAGTTPIDCPLWAISHSWTNDMQVFNTPINEFEWPVPVPVDVSLEAVRTELLNMGVEYNVGAPEYVWLDVLCIRQKSLDPTKESVRLEEWRVDLPTIGTVFHRYTHRVVRYMNGLGRPFEASGWDDDKHWLNRAWTLQEAKKDSIIGGIPFGLRDPRGVVSVETGIRLQDILNPIDDIERRRSQWPLTDEDSFMHIVNAMIRRRSTNPVDRVFGIGMIFCKDWLPLYNEKMREEEAWTTCVAHLPTVLQAVFLFLFTNAGDGMAKWRLSWAQLMSFDADLNQFSSLPRIPCGTLTVYTDGMATYNGPVVEVRLVPVPRYWTTEYQGHRMDVRRKPTDGIFSVIVNKTSIQHLPDGNYTLVGNNQLSAWAVCTKILTQNFDPRLQLQKVASLWIDDEELKRNLGAESSPCQCLFS